MDRREADHREQLAAADQIKQDADARIREARRKLGMVERKSRRIMAAGA